MSLGVVQKPVAVQGVVTQGAVVMGLTPEWGQVVVSLAIVQGCVKPLSEQQAA